MTNVCGLHKVHITTMPCKKKMKHPEQYDNNIMSNILCKYNTSLYFCRTHTDLCVVNIKHVLQVLVQTNYLIFKKCIIMLLFYFCQESWIFQRLSHFQKHRWLVVYSFSLVLIWMFYPPHDSLLIYQAILCTMKIILHI